MIILVCVVCWAQSQKFPNKVSTITEERFGSTTRALHSLSDLLFQIRCDELSLSHNFKKMIRNDWVRFDFESHFPEGSLFCGSPECFDREKCSIFVENVWKMSNFR